MVKFGSKRMFPTEVIVKSNLISTTGRVYMKDEFDSPVLNWKYDGSVGGTAVIQADEKYSGTGALKLTPPAGISEYAGCSRQIPTPETKRVGLDCVFGMDYDFDGSIIWELLWYDGITHTNAAVKYDQATTKWYVATTITVIPFWEWVEIPDSAMTLTAYEKSFIRLKFVIDMTTQSFVSLIVQDKFFDISAYPCGWNRLATSRQLYVRITNYMGAANVAYSAFIDNVIITEE